MDTDKGGGADGELAQLERQLNCMGTEDEDTLVRQFQELIAPHADLSPDLCRFFLDMNNWNLQEALGSFYDYNAQQMIFHSLPSMQFVADITVGEGESVPPNSRFVKTWRLRNNGPEQWSNGSCLRHIEGDQLADFDHVEVEALRTNETADVSVTMSSPSKQGVYQSRWRMFTSAGMPFGETIWCIIVVDDGGLLDLTQRLASTNCGTGVDGGAQDEQSNHAGSSASTSSSGPLGHARQPFDHTMGTFMPGPLGYVNSAAHMDGMASVSERPRFDFFAPLAPHPRMTTPRNRWENTSAGQQQTSGGGGQILLDSPDDSESNSGGGNNQKSTRPGIGAMLVAGPNIMSAVSVVQPLQPLYGPPSSTDDDMEN